MPKLIIYLLQTNLSLSLFYLGYYFFLRKLTFYDLNRCYFLFGLLFSLAYPLADLSSFFQQSKPLPSALGGWLPNWQQLSQHQPTQAVMWDTICSFLFCTAILLGIKFLISLLGLYRIHRSAIPAHYSTYRYQKVRLPIAPFSFWRSIYVHPDPYTSQELDNIFRHEYQHVRNLHTVDILLTELISFFCWFNPAIWLIRKAIKENLEFITDRNVIRNGADKKHYQYSLVNVLANQQQSSLVNHFSFKDLKKRILMMNKSQSSKVNMGTYIFTVPAIVLCSFTFTFSNAVQDEGIAAAFQTQPIVKAKSLADTIKNKPLYFLDGKEISHMDDLDPNSIESIHVFKGASATKQYGERGRYGAVLIISKKPAAAHIQRK